jgi:general stress protein 26
MAAKTLKDISSKMRKLDICMMTTQSGSGALHSRPMSNNGDVEYDGNSYFFTYEGSQKIKDITVNPQINLAFNGPGQLYIAVLGKGKIIRSKAKMEEHWLKELEQWFSQGLDTPGVVMIHVKATHIHYWQGEEEGTVKM